MNRARANCQRVYKRMDEITICLTRAATLMARNRIHSGLQVVKAKDKSEWKFTYEREQKQKQKQKQKLKR